MLFLALFALVFAIMDDNELIADPELIAEINNDKDCSWTAHVNPMFAGKTFKDVKHLLGWLGALESKPAEPTGEVSNDLPSSFDTYTKWPSCKHPIRNQENCGSCWAFSAAEAMSDRYCIAGKDLILSPQCLVSCESDEYACQGGYLSREWEYLENTGIVTDKCFPYKSGFGQVPPCPNKCEDGTPWTPHKVTKYTHYTSVEQAMTAMQQYGSFQVAFSVYKDFFNYHSGVYTHKSGALAGGHAVKAQGWGVDSASGQKYWNIANSWGPSWGMNGYFWILRGADECGIEDQMYGGIPDI